MVRGPAARDLGPMPETPSSPEPHQPHDDLPPASEAPTTQAPQGDAQGAGPQGGDAPPAGDSPRAEAPRRLLRSRDDRVLGGVCGGLARYFGIDPLIVRIAAVALIFVGGFAIVAYIAALFLVPEDDGTGHPVDGRPSRLATILGAVAVVLAGVLLLNGSWGLHLGWAVAPLVPLVLIVLVLAIAGQRLLANRGEDHPPAGRIAVAALLLMGGLIAACVAAFGAAWATAAGGGTIIAAIVIALGLAMVVFAFNNRSARWLALPALVLAIPSGVVAAAGVDTDGGIGQRTYKPATVGEVKTDTYKLGIGELVVDLRNLRWPQGTPLNVKVDVGTGHALVLVPRDVCVQSDVHVGAGYVNVLGDESGGADVEDQRGTLARATTGPQLHLEADMGLGAVEVRHQRTDGHWDNNYNGRPDTIDGRLADLGCAGARA
jgi:phage shock protein PspC (stress-responsive transcriptional regulator)